MRVHRITVRDVKGVRERTVELPETGVVVVEGPNEVGKSTLLEAFDKLLDPRLKSTSSSKEVRRLQPVGRDVGPYVEAELTIGGHRVRYAKRWLRQPTTTLEVLSPVPEQLSGEAAHARMEQLLRDCLDRTLWDALRLAQSDDGRVAPLADSAVLSAALDAASGSELHAEGGDQVLDLVEREYLTYFTRTGRPTSDYRRAMTDHTEAQDAVGEAHRRLEEAERLLDRREAARVELEAAEERLEQVRAEHAAALEAQARADALLEAHATARAVLGQARERSRAIAHDRSQRAEQAAQLGRLAAELHQTEERRADDAAALERLGPALAEAEAAVARADEELERAEAVADLARADVDHLRQLEEVRGLETLVERVRDVVDRLAAARASVPARAVGPREVRRARELHQRAEVLAARHEAASARVRVESLDGSVEVGSEATGTPTVLPAGEVLDRALTDELVLTVPGAVRVVLEPEAGGRERREELAAVRAELEELLAEAGARSVDELAAAADATAAAEGAVRDLARDLETLLAGRPATVLRQALAGAVPDALVAELAEVRELAAAGDRPDRDHPLPDDVATARAVARAAAAEVQVLRETRRAAVEAHRERLRGVATLRARLDRADGSLESLRRQEQQARADLDRARETMPDEALDEELQRRSAVLAEAELAEARARRALAEADVQAVADRLASAARRLEEAERACQAAGVTLHTLSGQVEMAQSEGRRELYDQAVAALDECERRLASVDRRARAARHLWRTLTEHRDRAHATYARPFTRALEELGRRVYGPTFGVTVDDQLVVRARTLDGRTVPFEELSGGAKEQLGILARLAVARLVDPDQGVPVVLDDALGYTDPDRLRQMGEVLGASAAGAEVQVILLTCTPDRYAAVPQASTVRLPA
ncbi:ATP-binding protein [Ornithinimicrobium humiphilum]|uniref:DNA repair exonuclease SbcCD ATPase subunit n=1 Tax=Ornithinimicrobium humiphilum TaxID=125288 RepID=A0A543KKN0_9MICO|nr:AAA family ATPase [Ornithinimicrobium humiphilum]TQM95637.1 DNA repair exonuclease SbcCD ATPase subunit [Ornithinimicrobium humiphilum]